MKLPTLKGRSNASLGLIALALGILTLVAGNSHGNHGNSIDPKRLAYLVQNELDHVTAFELATWIMNGRADVSVIDLRDAKSFQTYHIPGALNLSLTTLVSTDFRKDRTIVLYSEGGVHSAQGMFLLWAEGYKNVFMLKGGLNEWSNEVLHPVIDSSARNQVARDSVEALRRLSSYFGGATISPPPSNSAKPKVTPEREKLRDEC